MREKVSQVKLPGYVSPIERFVFPVGTVCSPVDTEGGISGGLEVIQPHKSPAHPNLSFLPAAKEMKDKDVKNSNTHTPSA